MDCGLPKMETMLADVLQPDLDVHPSCRSEPQQLCLSRVLMQPRSLSQVMDSLDQILSLDYTASSAITLSGFRDFCTVCWG